jgi:hypothetical protein
MAVALSWGTVDAQRFEGKFYRGAGDVEYLELLETARRMFDPDPEFQNLPMLYTPAWNGFVEGPTWGAWWIQNSYGPTYCGLPFWQEPFLTFVQNSQELWFSQMGDGKRVGGQNWRAPDGCLCDAASPGWIYYKQGDGRVDIHDWGMEFTAAGLVLQAELLLVSRDAKAIAYYLPKLRRVANFLDSRRDPQNNLFLAGPAGNLLAPSYAGYRRPDGTYGKAYLAGLSITTIAGLDRLIELEKLAGNAEKVKFYCERRALARRGLPLLTTREGYFIKSLDPDGARHGVYGAPRHGYFEAVPNHDAICFRVVDDAQAERIYARIASIPGLRRYDLMITNCPSLDDMYEPPAGLWEFGRWVNGGHWSTCEARAMMAYSRLGKYDDARRSMKRILAFARRFRMDNNLTNFGSEVYQPNEPINCVYDTWGVPAALIRGLFEYLYRADGLTILPHIPPGVVELEQQFPVRFGAKRLWLATAGSGPITSVLVNGKPCASFDARSIFLPYDATPSEAAIRIALGGARIAPLAPPKVEYPLPPAGVAGAIRWTAQQFPVISSNTLPLRIGADSEGGNRFLGDIARPRVFCRALGPAEVAALAQDAPGPLDRDPALVGYWTLDNRQGQAFPNAAGPGLPARIVGAVSVVEGRGGKAVHLAGGYLEVAHDPKLDLRTACTLSAWVRPRVQPPTGSRILDKSKAGTANGYLLDTCPGNSLRLIVERGSIGVGAQLAADRWVHVAATVDGEGSLALYVNGKVIAAETRDRPPDLEALARSAPALRKLHQRLAAVGLADCYEAAHARLALWYLDTCNRRWEMLAQGKLKRLPGPSQYAADKSYLSTAAKLGEGLEKVIHSYRDSPNPHKRQVYQFWSQK